MEGLVLFSEVGKRLSHPTVVLDEVLVEVIEIKK
jgi:hypothetical protein